MDYNFLKYIITVDKHQSISKAAEELYLSQPNISKAIQAVEKETGIQIFIRTSKGVSTTLEGKNFIKKASKIVNSFDDFTKEFINDNKQQFAMNIAHHRDIYFQNKILDFSHEFNNIKNINVNILEGNSDEIIEMVSKEQVNLGIICVNEHDLAYYKKLFTLNDFDYEIKETLKLKVTFHECNSLANKNLINRNDLINQTLITTNTNDFYRYYHEKYQISPSEKSIKINVSLNQMATLSKINNSYLFSLPISEDKLQLFNCKSVDFEDGIGNWVTIAIYKKSTSLSDLELNFIDEL